MEVIKIGGHTIVLNYDGIQVIECGKRCLTEREWNNFVGYVLDFCRDNDAKITMQDLAATMQIVGAC